jgi:predicted MFS family arabinose efflux permease
MFSPRLKPVYFTLEGLNAFATSYYFYYLFFYLHDHFGFGTAQNLAACALHGFLYMGSSWFSGRYSQRAGYFVALPLGFGLMAAALLGSALAGSVAGILAGLSLWTFGMSFTWPTLEALASEGETPVGLRRMVGIYNLVWAGGSAVAYFVGGALKETLGDSSLFWLPALLHGLKLGFVLWLKGRVPAGCGASARPALEPGEQPERLPAGLRLPPKAFLIMAWVANPFAYVAINAAGPVIPQLAERLHLTTSEAGFFCSIWFFARLAAFALLWRWKGWHYRFRWLLAAFLVMTLSFSVMLLASHILVIALAQIGLGGGVGLIYYSSLYYSMDVGETKGEHGGIHEAVIGSGVFGGAAIGSAGQYLLGGQSSSTWVVSAVLVAGLAGLLLVRRRFVAASRLLVVLLLGAGAALGFCRAGAAPVPGDFLVQADGSVLGPAQAHLQSTGGSGAEGSRVRYDFGLPRQPPVRRWLEAPGLPICRSTWEHNGIRYTQVVLATRLEAGAPLSPDTPAADGVLMVRLIGENTASDYTEASAALAVRSGSEVPGLELRGDLIHLAGTNGGALLAVIEIPAGGMATSKGPALRFSGNMPPGITGSMTLKIPAFRTAGSNQFDRLRDLEFDDELERVKRFWADQTHDRSSRSWPVAFADPPKP